MDVISDCVAALGLECLIFKRDLKCVTFEFFGTFNNGCVFFVFIMAVP